MKAQPVSTRAASGAQVVPAAPARQPFVSIASRLIRRIVLLAVGCAALLATVHVAWQHDHDRVQYDRTVRLAAENSLQTLSVALWDVQLDAARAQLDWLAELPEIGYLRLHSATGESFSAGDGEAARGAPSAVLPIPSAQRGGLPLGTLEVWADHDRFAWQTARVTALLLAGYAFFTLCICAAVAWVLERELRRPLQQVAWFASELKPSDLSRPLVLDRPARHRADEIDLVTEGFQTLQGELKRHIDHLGDLVAERTEQLERMVDEVRRLSITDALTGCLNRRAVDQRLPGDIERCLRYGRPLSVVALDLDHFKAINDNHGHLIGDEVLRQVGYLCRAHLRDSIDWVARLGGEEFVIVLPETELQDAIAFAERLSGLLRAEPLRAEGLALRVTASFGVTEFSGGETLDDFLARADLALYRAKAQGRDCVVSIEPAWRDQPGE